MNKRKEKIGQGQNRNSGNNNFNQFGVGALKHGGKIEESVNSQIKNNDGGKVKQVYVPVSPNKKKNTEARNSNKENLNVDPNSQDSKYQSVKSLANKFDIFNRVDISGDGIMEELIINGNSVGAEGNTKGDVVMSDGPPGVEKSNTKSSSGSQ